MQLVEQHCIKKSDPGFAAIDAAAFASKNLYNQVTYQIRQDYIHRGKYLPYAEIFHRVKHLECYQALPRKVSNSILILIDKNWRAYRNALNEWSVHPEKFTGKPNIPAYKHKEKGRNILLYDKQALGKRAFKKTGKLVPSGLPIEIETKVAWDQIDQVRIVPRGSSYVIEVVYQKEIKQAVVDPTLIAAIDLGVNQLATVTSTKPGFSPVLVNGRPLKHLNKYYNQQRARHQSRLSQHHGKTSCQLDRITTKCTRRVNHYLHTASRRIIDVLVAEGIGTLVIGLNKMWKQGVEMGKRNNQTFVSIPHHRFIEMLRYKAQLVGVIVVVREESYTSKASFLDLDEIPNYDPKRTEKPAFSGQRETRGLYRASDGRRIQADVNGSYNILRKEFPHAFSESFLRGGQEILGAAVHPRQLIRKRREDTGSSVRMSCLNG
ncbi:transposase [Ktedonobacteria bacterium brp13]|nr:transposase [Ktedonobacteria bacterium brp13]